jgi:hypothetical protein
LLDLACTERPKFVIRPEPASERPKCVISTRTGTHEARSRLYGAAVSNTNTHAVRTRTGTHEAGVTRIGVGCA